MLAALAAAGLAFIIATKLSWKFCSILGKVNYLAVITGVIIFVTAMTIFFDSLLGLLVLAASTALGIFVSELGIGKNHLMACLIVPVIFYFVL